MGRKKSSSSKPLSAVTKRAMSRRLILLAERSSFSCLFCDFKDSVYYHVNNKNAAGSLKCSNCARAWARRVSCSSFALEPIEVYAARFDAAVEAQQATGRAGDGRRPTDLVIIEDRQMIAQRRAQNATRGPAVAETISVARKPHAAPPAIQATRRKEIADVKANHEKHKAEHEALEQQKSDEEDQQKATSMQRCQRVLSSPEDRALRTALTRSLGDTKTGGVGMSPVSNDGNLCHVDGSLTSARRANAQRAAREAVRHSHYSAYSRYDFDDDVEAHAAFAPEVATREGAVTISSEEASEEE